MLHPPSIQVHRPANLCHVVGRHRVMQRSPPNAQPTCLPALQRTSEWPRLCIHQRTPRPHQSSRILSGHPDNHSHTRRRSLLSCSMWTTEVAASRKHPPDSGFQIRTPKIKHENHACRISQRKPLMSLMVRLQHRLKQIQVSLRKNVCSTPVGLFRGTA